MNEIVATLGNRRSSACRFEFERHVGGYNPPLTIVGSATFTFANSDSATFAYTMNGVSQTKSMTRQVFRLPGTVCK
jgi:hypothetical protein